MTEYECARCLRPRHDEQACACGETRRLVRQTLEATTTSTATLTGVATNVVTVVKRAPAGAATAITVATAVVANAVKTRLSHHGPLADVAGEATSRTGEHVADRLWRRAVKAVTRTTTFRA